MLRVKLIALINRTFASKLQRPSVCLRFQSKRSSFRKTVTQLCLYSGIVLPICNGFFTKGLRTQRKRRLPLQTETISLFISVFGSLNTPKHIGNISATRILSVTHICFRCLFFSPLGDSFQQSNSDLHKTLIIFPISPHYPPINFYYNPAHTITMKFATSYYKTIIIVKSFTAFIKLYGEFCNP